MWALVPLKRLDDAKQRLAGFLTPGQRIGLSRAMVTDVLTSLSQTKALAGVVLVSPDPNVKALAEKFRCDYLLESELGVSSLNGAIEAAVTELAARHIDDVLVVHGDLPLISEQELSSLLRTHETATGPRMTIVPDRHGTGSNCIAVSPASDLKFCFGEHSFRRHVRSAHARGMAVRVENLSGAALDIDTRDDCWQFMTGTRRTGHTQDYLQSIGLCAPVASVVDSWRKAKRISLWAHQSE